MKMYTNGDHFKMQSVFI